MAVVGICPSCKDSNLRMVKHHQLPGVFVWECLSNNHRFDQPKYLTDPGKKETEEGVYIPTSFEEMPNFDEILRRHGNG